MAVTEFAEAAVREAPLARQHFDRRVPDLVVELAAREFDPVWLHVILLAGREICTIASTPGRISAISAGAEATSVTGNAPA
jgi:hypothetical protein